jgi:hypothetical protein
MQVANRRKRHVRIAPDVQATATGLTPRRCESGGNPSQFVRHDPSLPLVVRADERRRVKAVPTELARTQTAAWPWVRAGVASSLNYAPD